MAVVATGEMAVTPDLRGFEKSMGSSIGRIAKNAAGIFGGAFAVSKGLDFLGSAVGDARESNKVAAQVEQAIKSTGGAAKVTAKEIDNLANSISRKTGIDDEEIASASAMLLTFTNVRNEAGKGNDIFNQSTAILADMSRVFKTDASGAAIQLGKALNDPIKGVTALTRVGVQFSDVQKEQIKNFVESGRVADAQKVILAELTKEFGGQAEAQADAGDKLRVTIGNIKEDIGNQLIPVIDKVATFLAEKLPAAITWTETKLGELWAALQPVRDYIANTLAPALQDAADNLLPKLQDAIQQVGDAFRANKPQIEELGRAIQTITPYLVDIGRIIETLVINQIAGLGIAFAELAGGVVTVWDGIVDTIRGAVNKVIDAINLLIKAYNLLPFGKNIDPLGHVTFGQSKPGGGQTKQRTKAFAHGGVVPGRLGAPVAAVVHGGEEVLTAAQRRERGGNVFHVSVQFAGQVSEQQAYTVGQAVGRGAAYEMDRAAARRSARVA